MGLPVFSMRQLLEAGVHFGHNTRRWDPRMAPYLYGSRNGIHIIDLQQTVPLLHQAMVAVRDIVGNGGRVLFVGTKRQAQEKIAESAKKCGQYYVNHRWLGGMLTNWRTISNSIKRLKDLEKTLTSDGETIGLTKKELLNLTRERGKLDKALGGIKEMGGQPDILVIVDTNKEDIAVSEAKTLGIPVVGIIDSNSNPTNIQYPIPGNDDAIRAISLYCDLLVGAALEGIQLELEAKNINSDTEKLDLAEEVPSETSDVSEDTSVNETESQKQENASSNKKDEIENDKSTKNSKNLPEKNSVKPKDANDPNEKKEKVTAKATTEEEVSSENTSTKSLGDLDAMSDESNDHTNVLENPKTENTAT